MGLNHRNLYGWIDAHRSKTNRGRSTPGGFLAIENYHRDINRNAWTGGKIGYPANILLETYVPLLRIVRYEEVLDFPDWSNQGEKVPLVRLLAKKG